MGGRPRAAPGVLPTRKALAPLLREMRNDHLPSLLFRAQVRGARCPGPQLAGGIINKIDAPNGSKKDHGATHYQGLELLIIRFSAAVTCRTHLNHGAPTTGPFSLGPQRAVSMHGAPRARGKAFFLH